MNYIDIIVLVMIVFYALVGFWKGFIPQLFQFVGIFCAFYFNTPVSKFISGVISEEPEGVILMLVQVAAFFLIFAVFYITGKILSKTFDIILTSIPNRIAGIIFGALNGFLVVCFLFLIVRSIGSGDEYLRKHVTPDSFTDNLINKSLDIPAQTNTESEGKVYSRLGYGAYRISMMMDPFVVNLKNIFRKKYDDIIEIKVSDKIQHIKDSLLADSIFQKK
jgi:uncharacterized membrane protein required for colicin V production